MQLVAYGAQDIYLTGNPQITFFKVVYRRHTNFAIEAIEQTMNGTADFGSSVSVIISRNGDLVNRMYLEHDAKLKSPASDDEVGVVSSYGSRLMKEYVLEIGGQKIDKHYGHWHEVWSQLTEFNPTGSNSTLFNKMSGNGEGRNSSETTLIGGWTMGTISGAQTLEGKFWIPLYLWFCRNPGLALPLIALQYHEVTVKITFEDIGKLAIIDGNGDFTSGTDTSVATSTNNNGSTFNLWCDYIYLDTDERRRFAQVSHEYLIEQVQHSTISDSRNFNKDINFNHPVKELIWSNINQPIPTSKLSQNNTHYVTSPLSLEGNFKLKLNGNDRFAPRDSKYFTRTQVWQHHTGYGGYIGQNGTFTKDVQTVTTSANANDLAGTYTLTLGGNTTAALATGTREVQTVKTSASANDLGGTFTLTYGAQTTTALTTGVKEVQTLTTTASAADLGGTLGITYGSYSTTVSPVATAMDMTAAINSISGISNASVTRSSLQYNGYIYTITFDGLINNGPLSLLTLDTTSLGGTGPTAVIAVSTTGVAAASGDDMASALNALSSIGTTTVTRGSPVNNGFPYTVTFDGLINNGNLSLLTKTTTDLTGSTPVVTIAQTTAGVDAASASTMASALNALASITGATVTRGSPANNGFPYTVTFDGVNNVGDVPLLTVAKTLTGTVPNCVVAQLIQGAASGVGGGVQSKDTIAVYSFAIKPEEHQPSGTCNFSRIDSAQLNRSGSTAVLTGGLNVYAVNYNVLRIMSGMGGLAYSN